MSTTSPNMNLSISAVGQDSGLNWEMNLNSSLTTIDGHNHSSGQGVQIQPNGLNINADLTFNGNAATNLGSVVFLPQSSLSILNALYVIAGDLYFNDGAGDPPIRMTAGGSVNATSSGIVSGSATASFVSSVLVVNSATNTPANIQGGSILLGNMVANSKYLTLNPPSAMASNFSLTLPTIPGSTSFLQIDSSGNISSGVAVSGGITSSNIASGAVGSTQIANGAVGPAQKSALNYILSSSTTVSTSWVSIGGGIITAISVSLTTHGRPIMVKLIGGYFNYSGQVSSIFGSYALSSNSGTGTNVATTPGYTGAGSGTAPAALSMIDAPAAGTYTYILQIIPNGIDSGTVGITTVQLLAYEL